jgi:hypothetical protein
MLSIGERGIAQLKHLIPTLTRMIALGQPVAMGRSSAMTMTTEALNRPREALVRLTPVQAAMKT